MFGGDYMNGMQCNVFASSIFLIPLTVLGIEISHTIILLQ
jgi:hypothetical protein